MLFLPDASWSRLAVQSVPGAEGPLPRAFHASASPFGHVPSTMALQDRIVSSGAEYLMNIDGISYLFSLLVLCISPANSVSQTITMLPCLFTEEKGENPCSVSALCMGICLLLPIRERACTNGTLLRRNENSSIDKERVHEGRRLHLLVHHHRRDRVIVPFL